MLREHHQAEIADFEEFRWIIQYGDTDVWYKKPSRMRLRQMARQERAGREPEDLPVHEDFVAPLIIEVPRVWASAALTTSVDDDITECKSSHTISPDSDVCEACTEEKIEALSSTPLQYCVVVSAWQAGKTTACGKFYHIGACAYRIIRCGSREAAISNAMHVARFGWNVVFSCVLRLGETSDERSGPFERVDELWNLAEEVEDESTIRIFY